MPISKVRPRLVPTVKDKEIGICNQNCKWNDAQNNLQINLIIEFQLSQINISKYQVFNIQFSNNHVFVLSHSYGVNRFLCSLFFEFFFQYHLKNEIISIGKLMIHQYNQIRFNQIWIIFNSQLTTKLSKQIFNKCTPRCCNYNFIMRDFNKIRKNKFIYLEGDSDRFQYQYLQCMMKQIFTSQICKLSLKELVKIIISLLQGQNYQFQVFTLLSTMDFLQEVSNNQANAQTDGGNQGKLQKISFNPCFFYHQPSDNKQLSLQLHQLFRRNWNKQSPHVILMQISLHTLIYSHTIFQSLLLNTFSL
ncbi:unnamed protein product (macronuclear) [Paramecium tetraurelia]|uniref:Uncharacterized protein n=1 Tax=Paramecium tetraurelia TaxID=5888 RepID=A0C1W2_PARTE|nr:uncharacterized protein GSPATT00034256001 [Paramecium tetraurelia]CAK64779.1 unnamed protein product [Paramecium tetraurelia]|eukprot:XP_001432176.1 hypothetical protein (macronuclear) [Paramecium tetraurelia strain d4-2]